MKEWQGNYIILPNNKAILNRNADEAQSNGKYQLLCPTCTLQKNLHS
jgi:hypothetical protein